MSYPDIRTAIWAATLIFVCGVAVARGGRDARLAAGALTVGWLLTLAAYRYRLQGTEWGVLIVDLALLAVLIWIALRSHRWWPLLAAGFHLLAVITHVARTIDVHLNHWAYITAEIIWGYLLAWTIGYGAWTNRPRQAVKAAAIADPGATRR